MRRRKRTSGLTWFLIFSTFLLMALGIFVFINARVQTEYITKQGYEVRAEVFRRYDWDFGKYHWVEKPDLTTTGTKKGVIYVFPKQYEVTIYVKDPFYDDVVPPKVEVQELVCEYGEQVKASQFIVQIEDLTKCTVQYLVEPDSTGYGTQEITLVITDMAGNSTIVDSLLHIPNVKEYVLWDMQEEPPEAEVFLAEEGSDISYITEKDSLDCRVPSVYQVDLLVDGIEVQAVLEVQDISAPNLILQSTETWLNKPLLPEAFVDMEQSGDNSGVMELGFVGEPDWKTTGEQLVKIAAVDTAGNVAMETVTLTIKRDEIAPIVTVTDIDICIGGQIAYKKAVSYSDNIDTMEEMTLTVEQKQVNLDEVGSYEVIYTVSDSSGNVTSVKGKVNVLEAVPAWADEEAIHVKAQNVIDEIITEAMTEREKAQAIYQWIRKNISYESYSEKGNYMRGAYEGLFEKSGDCFVFAAVSKELLTLAGIKNIDVVKAATDPSHYWNLVYLEDGWYHFDATPRKDKTTIFLWTDTELEQYSTTHNNSHIFDRSMYPEIVQ